jgi:predicted transcriptional regulator
MLCEEELAASSGVSVPLIRKMEQGEYGGIRLETVRKILVVDGRDYGGGGQVAQPL